MILLALLTPKTARLRVVITGLPRSGTSFLACLVHHLGFDPGPAQQLKGADANNPYGYFENRRMIRVENEIFERMGGNFMHLPPLENGWTNRVAKQKSKILRIVSHGGLEMYKGNRAVVLADLYHELFPDAKWLFIERPVEDTYRSRFGEAMTLSDWKSLCECRMAVWKRSVPAEKALYVKYSDFNLDTAAAVQRVASHLGVTLDDARTRELVELFRPREQRSDTEMNETPRGS